MPDRMTIVQLVPSLESGGVERGTLEVGEELVRRGHRSIVISGGGRLVPQLTGHGSEHHTWNIGSKNPLTLLQVPKLRRFLREQNIDIVHALSRVPAWVGYLAWRGMKELSRPRFLTTVQGLHSVNWFSAVMTRGERVIAISETVRDYITKGYPKTPGENIRLIKLGVDPSQFPFGYHPTPDWRMKWFADYPQLEGRPVITLPGRLTRLKGHHDFVELMSRLKQRGSSAVGLIVGDEDPRRRAYAQEIRRRVAELKLDNIVFTGYRGDIREVLSVSNLVLSLSTQPESFGRTILEALSLGVPAIGYDHGGVGEILREVFPAGAVKLSDLDALTARVEAFLATKPAAPEHHNLTLRHTLDALVALYEELATQRRAAGTGQAPSLNG